MSNSRQGPARPEATAGVVGVLGVHVRSRAEPAVRGYAVTHPRGAAVLPIEPGWNQLLYTASGSMTVSVAAGSWTIPPHRALWLPAGVMATVANRHPVAVSSLYLASSLEALPDVERAMEVPRFCRELLLHVVRRCPLDVEDDVQRSLLTVLVDQLHQLPDAPLWLPRPTDPRAVAFAAAVESEPGASSDRAAHDIGVGRRTLERIFRVETGHSLGAWRRRATVLASLDLLTAGATVTEAARSAAYATPSAYVAAFRQELGTTPRRFLG